MLDAMRKAMESETWRKNLRFVGYDAFGPPHFGREAEWETYSLHTEEEMAWAIARQIASHPLSRDQVPDHHLGEAQTMVLAARPEFVNDALLLDELAARAVAEEIGLPLSGFAGVLLVAVQEGLLTADELEERLKTCQSQGTHYSEAFIERVYLAATGVECNLVVPPLCNKVIPHLGLKNPVG